MNSSKIRDEITTTKITYNRGKGPTHLQKRRQGSCLRVNDVLVMHQCIKGQQYN